VTFLAASALVSSACWPIGLTVPSRVSELYLLEKQRRSCPGLNVVTTKARHAGEPKRIWAGEQDFEVGGIFRGLRWNGTAKISATRDDNGK
jgi:hypothetical protein